MQPFRGVNTSLYHSLDQQYIEHLERAIILTEQGAYEKAEVIFDGDLASQRLNSAVVLARAELALKQLKYGVLYRTLDEVLTTASKAGDCDLDAAEYRFMRLLRAFAAFSHKADVSLCHDFGGETYTENKYSNALKINPAVEEIGRARDWLKAVPVIDYTDIQVGFV